MAFLWFILAVIFFILWVSANNSKTRNNRENYDRGYVEGRQDIIKVISKDLKAGPLNRKSFGKYVSESEAEIAAMENMAMTATGIVGLSDTQALNEEYEANSKSELVGATYKPEPAIPKRSKAEQANRNLNTLLYTASFLIIAAAAAFIATNTPASVRLAGLWTVIIAFYVVGLVLHAKVPYLKPAATAFVGTGLALIPFAGIALSQLGGLSGGWSWCLTSIIGLVAYAVATVRLSSNIVGYLTIAFSLSLAASTVAVISGPFVLYFVVLIVVSLLFHLAAHFKPSWVPSVFQRPIEQTGHLLTPVTLLGSLLAYDTMTAASYQIVFWVATAYYAVIWITNRNYTYETAVRILLTISVLITAFDAVEFGLTECLWIWLFALVAQLLYSFVRVKLQDSTSRSTEQIWYWVIIGLLVVSFPYWATLESVRQGFTAQLLVIGIASVAMAWRLRSVFVAIPALAASVALPFVIGRWPSDILISVQALTYIFVAFASITVLAYVAAQNRSNNLKSFLKAAFWLYFAFAFITSLAQGSNLAFALSSLVLAILTVAVSYIYRQWRIEILSVFMTVLTVGWFLPETSAASEWLSVLTIGITSVLYLIGGWIHHLLQQEERRDLLVVATLIVGTGLVFGSVTSSEAVKIVSTMLALMFALSALISRLVVKSIFLQRILGFAYACYPIIAMLVGIGLDAAWFIPIFAVATLVYWISSYAERTPGLMTLGNLTLIGLFTSAWLWLGLDSRWMFFGVAWCAATVYYASYLLHMTTYKDTARSGIQLISTWIILATPALLYLWSSGEEGYVAAFTLIVISITLIVHGNILNRKSFAEVGIYLWTFGLQRLVGLAVPSLDGVVYGHWWAATLFAVAYWRRAERGFVTRLVFATAAITLSSGIAALNYGGTYQLVFLVEHVILLVVGALSRTSWALWWGLVATVLAVLYFLRSSLFLSLLFLGLTLIGIVVWRLIKAQRK